MSGMSGDTYPLFTALDCLLLIADQTDQGKKEHKLKISISLSQETQLFTCSMFLRDKKICVDDISVDNVGDAKCKCAEKFLQQMFNNKLDNMRIDLNKALGYLRDKRLFLDKTKVLTARKVGVFFEKVVEVKSEIFGHEEIIFGATGRATDKLLSFVLAEVSIATQLFEHFMLGPLVRPARSRLFFEFSCKGFPKDNLPPEVFFERFPEMRDNLILLPDGRAICRICKQVDRSSLFASHNHTSVRRMLCRIHYCIENNDEKLGLFVTQSISALLKEEKVIAKYVSENKLSVLNSAIEALREEISDVKMEFFGQSEEGVGQCYYVLKFSVSSELIKSQEQLLASISHTLYLARDRFRFVEEDFSDAYPHIKSSHIESGLDCVFYLRRDASVELSRFLRFCSEVSPEVSSLCTVFNFWGSYCRLDEADSGYLHQFIFPLMVMHFLQNGVSPPRFPNLHFDQFLFLTQSPEAFSAQLKEMFARAKEDLGALPPVPLWKLWLLLLQFYWIDFNYFHKIALQLRSRGDGTLLPQVREELDKDYSRLFVMNPMRERNNIAFSMKTHHAYLYFFQCFKHTLEFYNSQIEIPVNAPKCLLESIRMYADMSSKRVIVTDSLANVPRKGTKDSKSYSDPCSDDEQIPEGADTASSPPLVLEYSVNITQDTTCESADTTATAVDSSSLTVASSEDASHTVEHSSEGEEHSSEEDENFAGHPDSPEAEEGVLFSDDVTAPSDDGIPEALLTFVKYAITPGGHDVIPAALEMSEEDSKKHCSRDNFIRIKFNPICGFCRDKGHTKLDCPKESLPPVLPVSPLPRENVRELNEGLLQLVNSHKMSAMESERRELLRGELEADVREIINQKFDLCLFGSSVNRFGSDDSDVDLCLVVPIEDTEDLDKNRLLRCIAKAFRGKKYSLRYTNVSQIPAKVPIIRFDYHLATKTYTCDISLSNLLALNNSRLLLTYASIDQRVQDLGLLVKHFGKVNDLADASQGGLSSYAYILLTIHFLQRTDPPIIPVLQQLRPPGSEESSVKVDTWECYFCEDTQAVRQLWKHKQNSKSLAELWLEFLCYCVSKFDWEKQVVTLRRLEPISKLDKNWTNRKIGIEDPFNLDHNLGTVLSFKNAVRLRKCLIESRAFYHVQRSPRDYLDFLKFDLQVVLRESQPPVRESRKPQPKTAPQNQFSPEEFPPIRSQDRDRPLLSWSNSLSKYCTADVNEKYGEFDIVQLSETLLISSDVFSKNRKKPDKNPQNKFPNGMNLASYKNDRILLSGPHCHDYTIINPNINGGAIPTNTQAFEQTSPHTPNSMSSPIRAISTLPATNSTPPQPSSVISPSSPECESLSLYELTRRVAQESRDMFPLCAPSLIEIPHPLDHAQFPDTLTEQISPPELTDPSKHTCEKPRPPVPSSPDTRPAPPAQKQSQSPGFKTGRGGGQPQFTSPQPLYSSKVETGAGAAHQRGQSYRIRCPPPQFRGTDRNYPDRRPQDWSEHFPQLSPPMPTPVQPSYPPPPTRGAPAHNRRGHRVSAQGDMFTSNRGSRNMRGRGAFVTHNQRNQRYNN